MAPADRARYWASLRPETKAALRYHWPLWARPEQVAPSGDWRVWLLLAGRGFGKSRSVLEWLRAEVESGRRRRLAIVARTAADVRDVLVEGESGILRISPPWFRPTYEPSKRRLTWPNGAVATTYSADEPDNLRGPEHDGAVCDELATWDPATWDMLLFGLRLGDDPRAAVATTPRPTRLIRELAAAPTTHVTRGRTADNRANLAPAFLEQIVAKYAGTRLGRQELDAEILDDNPDALWRLDTMIEPYRVREAPALDRIVVAIDPAVSSGAESDETGIVVAGKTSGGHLYVLDDRSLRASPDAWARAAIGAYHAYRADRIIAEANQGGEMVAQTLRTVDAAVPITLVHATRGKLIRAEPVAALYEQGRGHHVGTFAQLESQLTDWTPGDRSPDRLDALVWAATALLIGPGRVPLADEPDPAAPQPEQSLADAIREAQADPFAWADRHTGWDT